MSNYSRVEYTADGSTSTFAVSIPSGFISRSDISVYVDGVSSPFTWLSEGLVSMSETPASGSTVVIARETDVSNLINNYSNGSTITEENLNDSFLQSILAVQDVNDKLTGVDLTGGGTTTDWSEESDRLENLVNEIETNLNDISLSVVTAVEDAEDSATEAATSEDNAFNYAGQAATSEENAFNYASQAQSARDIAFSAQGVYPDTTQGLANTLDGNYFFVPNISQDTFLDMYLNNSGVADLVTTYKTIDGFFDENSLDKEALQTLKETSDDILLRVLDQYSQVIMEFTQSNDKVSFNNSMAVMSFLREAIEFQLDDGKGGLSKKFKLMGTDEGYFSVADYYGNIILEVTDNHVVIADMLMVSKSGEVKIGSDKGSFSYNPTTKEGTFGNFTFTQQGNGLALLDSYREVVHELGFDGTAFISGWIFGSNGSLTAPDGTVIHVGTSEELPEELPEIEGSVDELDLDLPEPLEVDLYGDSVVSALSVVTPARERLVRQVTSYLKDILPKTSGLYFLSADNQTDALINWANTGINNLVVNGTVSGTFKKDRGFTGNSTNFYLDTGITPSSLVQDNVSIACISHSLESDDSYIIDGGDTFRLAPRSGGRLKGNLNSNTEVSTLVTNPTRFSLLTRVNATTTSVKKNNEPYISDANNFSIAPSNQTIKLLGNGTNHSGMNLSIVYIGEGLSSSEALILMQAFEHWNRGVGSFVYETSYGYAELSTDVATYGNMTSQQIPMITALPGGDVIRCNYGIVGEPGEHGEGPGAYVRVSKISNPGTPTQTVEHGAFFLPQTPEESVVDSHIHYIPETGKVLLMYPYTKRGKHIWGTMLNNPQDDVSLWTWTEPCYLDEGFVGAATQKPNGDWRYTASWFDGGVDSYPYTESRNGNKYNRLVFRDDAVSFERLSTIPPAKPDPEMASYFETSVNVVSDGLLRAVFRTQGQHYLSISTDEKTWSTPVPTVYQSKNTKCDETRSPSGRLVLAFNDDPNFRANMSLALTEVDGIGDEFPYKVLLDGRGVGGKKPLPSYPKITFELDGNGDYTGYILVSWDCGRGRQDAPIYTNELLIARVEEQSIVDGNPNFTIATDTL